MLYREVSSIYLREVQLLRDQVPDFDVYPFSIPALRSLDCLALDSNVVFFVGENGTGKSTLLEAIADQCGFNPAGGSRSNRYGVHAAEASLTPYIRLSWLPKVTNGFFLRAETFYQFASHVDELAKETGYGAYTAYGGRSLHQQSHGEAFLSLFTHRFGRKAIYLLDEPEAALSPPRQLAFLRVMHELRDEVQFVIATHSPVILGYPGAKIYSFDTSPITETTYEETEHYQITKRFLNGRETFLRELFRDDDEPSAP